MNIQKSTPGPNRVWSPRIEESPVGEPYFRSPTVDKSELEKLPVHFGNARDSFDGAFTYEAPVVERELASTVPNEHIPQHWIGPRSERPDRRVYMNHPVSEEAIHQPGLVGLLAGNKVQYKMIDDRMVRTSEMSSMRASERAT